MMKIEKKELEKKAQSINNLIEGVVNETIELPNNALVFFDSESVVDIFTKKRLQLIRLINEHSPKSVQELANIAKRQKQAVDRDLKLLEQYEIVKLERVGRNSIPTVRRKLLMFNLQKPKREQKMVLEAEVFVNERSVNKIMLEVPL